MQDQEINFEAKLKAIYKSQDSIAPLIEGLIPQQSMKEYYVKLQIIIKEDEEKKHGKYEDISGQKKEVEPENIFENLAGASEDQKEINRVLILGGAGVGKTTLMQYLAYKWSSGELWKDKFDYVYRVSLKTLLNSEWKTGYSEKDRDDNLLKCLVHYNLTKDFKSKKERKLLTLDQIPWSTDEKTLLLLDGYDEIAHLRGDDVDFETVYEEIFEHTRLIFTSRPNAINRSMKERFDRVVENTGLDDGGIQQYFRQYFKNNPQRGKELEKFLSSNIAIKDICKIPVNIAMLCYIWSETDSADDQLDKISSVSSLYQEVIDRLEKRFFFHKKWRGAKIEGGDRKEKLDNGSLDLDELKVLRHVANKGLTGGGINISEKDRVETLIIKGVHDKKGIKDLKDEDGISIQSSINYLSRRKIINDNANEKVSIGNVHKFGLLKAEGVSTQTSSTAATDANKEEYQETDLQKQNYSFIHLTFQEYLAASYLKERLKNGDEQEKSNICQFIAEHRNEPRYLMTLKFMAGIVTEEQGTVGDQVAAMFWDAMICNVDGAIELGIKTKINLLLNLLGQSRVNGELDPRIPNKECLVNLIDFVILNNDDFLNWGAQLKESDYMSDVLKEGLVRAVLDSNLQWHAATSAKIAEKLPAPLQSAIQKMTAHQGKLQGGAPKIEPDSIFARGLEMACELAVKLGHENRVKILTKLEEFTENFKNHPWPTIRQVTQALIKILPLGDLKLEDNLRLIGKLAQTRDPKIFKTFKTLKQELLETVCAIIQSAKDSKEQLQFYDQVLQSCMPNTSFVGDLLKKIGDKESTTHILDQILKQYPFLTSEIKMLNWSTLNDLALSVGEKEFLIKVLEQFTGMFSDSFAFQPDCDKCIVELCRTIQVKEVVIKTIDQIGLCLSKIASNSPHGAGLAVDTVAELSRIIGEKEITVKALERVTSIPNFATLQKTVSFAGGIIKLCKLVGDKVTPIRTIAEAYVSPEQIIQLVELSGDKEILSKAIELSISNLSKADPPKDIILSLSHLFQAIKDDNLFLKAFLQLVNVLNNTDKRVRNDTFYALGHVTTFGFHGTRSGIAFKELIGLLKDKKGKQAAPFIQFVGQLARFSDSPAKDIEQVVRFLSDKDIDVRRAALSTVVKLSNGVKDKEISMEIHKQIMSFIGDDDAKMRQAVISAIVDRRTIDVEGLQKIINLVADNDKEVKICALNAIRELVRLAKDNETTNKAVQQVISLLTGSSDVEIIKAAVPTIVHLMSIVDNKQIVIEVLDKIIDILACEDPEIKQQARKAISELPREATEKEIAEKILEKLETLLTDIDEQTRCTVISAIAETARVAKNKEIATRALEQIINYVNDSAVSIKKAVLAALNKIAFSNNDEETVILVFKQLSDALTNIVNDFGVRTTALQSIISLTKTVRNKTISIMAIDLFNGLIQNDKSGQALRKEIISGLQSIALSVGDQEIIGRLFEEFGNLLSGDVIHDRILAINNIQSLLYQIEDSEKVIKVFEQLYKTLADVNKNQDYDSATREQIKNDGLLAVVEFAKEAANEDKEEINEEIIAKTLELFINGVFDEMTLFEDTMDATDALCEMHLSKETAARLFDQRFASFAETPSGTEAFLSTLFLGNVVKDSGDHERAVKYLEKMASLKDKRMYTLMFIDNALSNNVIHKKDLVKYLQHNKKELAESLTQFLKGDLEWFLIVEELLKNPDNLNMEAIKDKLINYNRYEDEDTTPADTDELANALAKLKQDNNPVTLIACTKTLVSRICVIHHINIHDMLETAFVTIGFEEIVDESSPKCELNKVAKKFLNFYLNYLYQDQLEQITASFHSLMTLSKESKPFFRNLYHKFLEDLKITSLEQQLIIKLINHGFTTSITRAGEIIFEGRKYSIDTSNGEFLLEEVARAVITQEQDLLAFQYKDYQPIFPRSTSLGMKKAAADVEIVCSMAEKSKPLSNESWIITILEQEENSTKIVLLEQRSVTGDHLVYELDKKNLMRLHPEGKTTRLEEIFGKYSIGQKYKGRVKVLTIDEGNELIKGTKSLSDQKLEKVKEYFQQELLGLGNTDRINYLHSELGNKLTDYNKVAANNLQETAKISPEEQNAIKEYYHAFAETFAMVYQSSQVINSGLIQLDAGDMKVKLLSTLVSFAPFIGNQLSSAVTTLNEILKSREMKQSAVKMIKLVPDVVGLNQLVGELACKIIMDTKKQQQIATITEKDFEEISKKKIDKLKILFEKIGEKVDHYLYGDKYTTLPAKLGEKDANTLIESWLKGELNHDNLQHKGLEIVLPGQKGTPQSPTKTGNTDTQLAEKRGTSCCQLF